MLDFCNNCRKREARNNKKPDCSICPDAPPKSNHLSEYMVALYRKATIARDGMGGLDYRFVDHQISKHTNDQDTHEAIFDYIIEVEGVVAKWRNSK